MPPPTGGPSPCQSSHHRPKPQRAERRHRLHARTVRLSPHGCGQPGINKAGMPAGGGSSACACNIIVRTMCDVTRRNLFLGTAAVAGIANGRAQQTEGAATADELNKVAVVSDGAY